MASTLTKVHGETCLLVMLANIDRLLVMYSNYRVAVRGAEKRILPPPHMNFCTQD